MRLVVLALLLVPALALADPHPMAGGANPAPPTDAQVAMTAETLTIAVDLRTATVRAEVTLANQGPATRLIVGFPCATGPDAGQVDVPCATPLTVTANGKRLRATKKATGAKVHHWTWPMKLAAGAQVTLVVSYRAPLRNDRYRVPAYGMGLFTYRLTTGARWAGPIGALRITVDHMHDALVFVAPAGGQRAPGRITWTLDHHEPTEEVVLMPAPMAGNRLAAQIGGKTAAEARARLAAGDYAKADVEAAVEALRRGGDEVDAWPSLISRLAGLPEPAPERVAATIAESIALLEQLAAGAKR